MNRERCWMGHTCCTVRSVHVHETIPRKCRACIKTNAMKAHPSNLTDAQRAFRVGRLR